MLSVPSKALTYRHWRWDLEGLVLCTTRRLQEDDADDRDLASCMTKRHVQRDASSRAIRLLPAMLRTTRWPRTLVNCEPQRHASKR